MAGTKRSQIVTALVDLFKQIDGTGSYKSNLFGNVTDRMVFFDEVSDFPSVSVTSGNESRQYLPGDFKWGFLSVVIRIYTNSEDSQDELERVMEDIENVLDANNSIALDTTSVVQISIDSIDWDGGALAPIAFSEIQITLQYDLK